jgi:hypothetical protein
MPPHWVLLLGVRLSGSDAERCVKFGWVIEVAVLDG